MPWQYINRTSKATRPQLLLRQPRIESISNAKLIQNAQIILRNDKEYAIGRSTYDTGRCCYLHATGGLHNLNKRSKMPPSATSSIRSINDRHGRYCSTHSSSLFRSKTGISTEILPNHKTLQVTMVYDQESLVMTTMSDLMDSCLLKR